MKTLLHNQSIKNTLLLALGLCSSIFTQAQNWNLVWADEFTNGIGPDWVFETGTGSGGWGNNELQYYRQQNATVENGQLVITAKNESFGGMNYTSARMKTQGRKSWKYGKIEARIAMPSFLGVWPAFWMLGDNITSVGWPSCGEIDVMEHVNTEAATHGTIHWQDHNNSYANYSGSTGTNVTAFHTYAVEWDANAIKWFLDGNLYHEASIAGGVNGTSEFHNNFFILLNMAIGGNWPGFNVDNGALPAKMYVDYVRVYQSGGGSSNGVATLFQHCDYGGYSASLNPGSYTLGQLQALGVSNDDISSIQIQSGYQLTMYQHNNFTGNSLVKTSNDNCLVNEGFNDNISSVIVAQASSGWSATIEAENWTVQSGTQTEACSEGGQNVGWIDTNDWMVWDINPPSNGAYTVEYRVSSPNSNGMIQLEKAGGSPVYGTKSVQNTGGWQNWTTVAHTISLSGGQQQIAIKALTGGWNINWFKITSAGGSRVVSEPSVPEPTPEISLSIFPNPASNLLNIKGLKGLGNYQIYDLSGKTVLGGILSSEDGLSSTIDVSSLNTGSYFLVESLSNTKMRFIKK
ncbi:carbohydrate-binding protein [Marinoscillum luteum]|uniref:Carbohydrate-binding protein n=1 Tax=Marinoscillum luteum TaxID=861051 RepID=A0ABW7N7H5_9BACT